MIKNPCWNGDESPRICTDKTRGADNCPHLRLGGSWDNCDYGRNSEHYKQWEKTNGGGITPHEPEGGFNPDYKDDPETLRGVIRDLTEACSNAEKGRAVLLDEVRELRDEIDNGDKFDPNRKWIRAALNSIVGKHGGGG